MRSVNRSRLQSSTADGSAFNRADYCFLSGSVGCDPPAEFVPVVTPVESPEPVFGLAPGVGPLPASFVEVAPLVGPLPASAFGCANAANGIPTAIATSSKRFANGNMKASLGRLPFNSGERRQFLMFPTDS